MGQVVGSPAAGPGRNPGARCTAAAGRRGRATRAGHGRPIRGLMKTTLTPGKIACRSEPGSGSRRGEPENLAALGKLRRSEWRYIIDFSCKTSS
jgi:hypothetical protein